MTTNAKKGNSFLLQIATAFDGSTYETVAAMRTTSLDVNKSSVDITNKDSTGWQELCPGGGVKSISISAEGVYSDGQGQANVIAASLASTHWNWKLIDEVGDDFTGAFHIDSLSFGGDANVEENFSITLSSADVIAYTTV